MEYPSSSKYAGRNYVDYILTAPPSGSTLDWSHNLMKLQPAGQGKSIDPRQFSTPVHLSRPYSLQEREIRTRDIGDAVMMPNEKLKEEPMDESLVAPADKKRVEGRKFGQKKTQRVYQTEASAIARTIAREERNPWLLEDSTEGKGHQRWVGRVEGGTASLGGVDDGGTGGTSAKKGGNYMLFVMDDQSNTPKMQVLPVHRWYKFFPKPLIKNLDAEEAEREFTKRAKAKTEDRWGVRNKKLTEAQARGEVRVKGEVKEEDAPTRGFSAIHGERRQARRRDEDQYDEFDYEDEFQDDEEGAGQYGDDAMDAEEAKELEDRIKKNQRGAVPFGEVQPVSDDVDPDDERQLDPTGKQAKKLLKKLEKVEYASDSDEDRNPYASDVDSDSDEPDGNTTSLKSSQSKPSLPAAKKLTSLPASRSGSPSAPTASSVAKRATSPRASKPSSRATSPRAASPTTGSKRKADDDDEGTGKKVKVVVDEAVRQALTAEVLVGFVKKAKTSKDASVKQVLKFIKSKLKVDPRGPGVMGHLDSLIRENLVLADGVLTLKE